MLLTSFFADVIGVVIMYIEAEHRTSAEACRINSFGRVGFYDARLAES